MLKTTCVLSILQIFFITLNLDTLNIKSLELLAKQVVEGFITGLHKSPYQGFSVEFSEHRLYNQGESTKNIDWKLFGRTDKLYVKRFEEETNLRCQVVLDVSSSMNYKSSDKEISKIKYSVICLASIIELLRRQRDAVGLTTFSDTIIDHISAKSSKSHNQFLFEKLEELLSKPLIESKTTFVETLHQVAEVINQRSLVVIFTDFFDYKNDQFRLDEMIDAMSHLKHKKHDVIVFHVADFKTEKDFDFNEKWLNLIDLETGEELKLDTKDFKEEYSKYMKAYFNKIEQELGSRSIDFVQVDVEKNPKDVLLPFLLKRSKMF